MDISANNRQSSMLSFRESPPTTELLMLGFLKLVIPLKREKVDTIKPGFTKNKKIMVNPNKYFERVSERKILNLFDVQSKD